MVHHILPDFFPTPLDNDVKEVSILWLRVFDTGSCRQLGGLRNGTHPYSGFKGHSIPGDEGEV